MKKLLLSAALGVFSMSLFAQGQAETYINEALNNVKAKQYKAAQLSLQDAINEINSYIAQEVLAQLPAEIDGLKAQISDDQSNSAAMAFMGGGTTITRKYEGADSRKNAEVSIVANSPLVGTMTALMGNPMMSNSANQKSIRVGTRRGILKKDINTEYDDNGTEKQVTNYELQVILGQTLVTVKGQGFETEQAFTAFYQKIDFEKIAKTLGE
jgi:hypothetical protein